MTKNEEVRLLTQIIDLAKEVLELKQRVIKLEKREPIIINNYPPMYPQPITIPQNPWQAPIVTYTTGDTNVPNR